MEAKLAVDCRNELGECCFWDPRDESLWWTDIERSCVYRMGPGSSVERFNLPGRAGFMLPCRDPGFVIGFPSQIVRSNRELTVFTKLQDVEPELHQTRINDAAVDPFGGIVFGTFDETQDMSARRPIASVYRLAPDGSLSRLFGNVTISNGIAFSPDGETMYFADSAVGRIRRFRVGAAFASLTEFEPLAEPDAAPGMPDGARVDADGRYWSARVWGGCVVRFGTDGEIDARVDLPVKGATCVAFGGSELSELYVTTLRTRHTRKELDAAPEAGGIFAAVVDTPGLPQSLCSI